MPPLARTEGVLVERLSDEVMVYDLDHDDIHCLNRVAAWVWQECDGATSVEELTRTAAAELDVPHDPDLVWLALEELEAARLLARPVERVEAVPTMNRREVARRLGLAGAKLALALPIITTLGAPTALQAASGIVGFGGVCTSDCQCPVNNNGTRCCATTGGGGGTRECKNGQGGCVGDYDPLVCP